MDFDDYCDGYEPTNEFANRLNALVTEEVKKNIKGTVDELESLKKEYALQSQELSRIRNESRTLRIDCEKEVKQAVKIAQREYWFDCAVGDKVYIIESIRKVKKCEKCGGGQKVSVIVDSIEVKAECPICGTYQKRQAMEYSEHSLAEAVVCRLQIELTSDHKWIKLWDKNRDREFSVENGRIFRTKEECQVALDSKLAK